MLVALAGTAVLLGLGWLATGRRRDGVVPAAIAGGLVGLVLRQLDLLPGTVEDWQLVAYHLFGISFLAIGLTPSRASGVSRGAAWLGLGQGMVFAVQAVVGGLVTIALRAVGSDVFPAFGFLAPMGLEEGPGQAVSVGGIWESAGNADAVALGATVASLGFVLAYGLGLVVLRLHARTSRERSGDVDPADASVPTSAAEPGSAAGPNADAVADIAPGRLGRMAVAVVLGYAVLYVVASWSAGLAGDQVRDTLLGVLFFVALLAGTAVRSVAGRAGVALTAGPQRRITELAVDGLTVAVLGSLAWASIAGAAGPLVVVVAATVAATAVVVLVASRSLPDRRFARGLALFGTVTGTVSSGLALVSLAEDRSGPVAVELGASVVVSAPFVLGGIALATATTTGAVAVPVAVAGFAVVAVGAGGAMVALGRPRA